MIIDKQILDKLTEQAKESPRLRMAMHLRNTPEDQSQRILNALEPGTILPIHRHKCTSETIAILRGKLRWIFFDDQGKETESVLLESNGEVRCINVEKGRWHSLDCLETGTVIFEAKDGKYHPLTEDEIWNEDNH